MHRQGQCNLGFGNRCCPAFAARHRLRLPRLPLPVSSRRKHRHDSAFRTARTLADSARARAEELGKALSMAVVDYGGFGLSGGSPDENRRRFE